MPIKHILTVTFIYWKSQTELLQSNDDMANGLVPFPTFFIEDVMWSCHHAILYRSRLQTNIFMVIRSNHGFSFAITNFYRLAFSNDFVNRINDHYVIIIFIINQKKSLFGIPLLIRKGLPFSNMKGGRSCTCFTCRIIMSHWIELIL